MIKRVSYAFIFGLVLVTSCVTRKSSAVMYPQVGEPVSQPVQVVTLKPESVVEKPQVQEPVVPSVKTNNSSIPLREIGTWQGKMQRSLDSICNTSLMETTQLGLYIYDMTDDVPLYDMNAKQRLRPASCQKLVTAISALNFLGGDYQFRTQVLTTGNISNGVLQGDLYVVGGMDPLLSTSNLKQLADSLHRMGINSINGRLYRDVSRKDDLAYGQGWCWDDDYGPLTALSVNDKDQFSSVWPGLLRAVGIMTKGNCTDKQCPADATLLTAYTHSIDEVLVPMMKKSDNIYAESMFYQIAFLSGLKHAGRKQAVSYIEKLISSLGLSIEPYQIADGSGLSLYNYVSPLLLCTLLKHAYQTEEIRNHLYPSLPISGVDGTLEKRMIDMPAAQRIHAKTGTVDGVSTLSGYAETPNGHLLVFSIMNQGVIKGSHGRDFQDKVCNILCR